MRWLWLNQLEDWTAFASDVGAAETVARLMDEYHRVVTGQVSLAESQAATRHWMAVAP